MEPDRPISSKAAHRRRRRWHPLSLSLWGIRELDYFASHEERAAALKEIADEAGRLSSLWFWLGVGVMAATPVIALFLARFGFRFVPLPRRLEEILSYLLTAAAFVIVLRWLHRSDAPQRLREKLLARGIPVCLNCGYLLKGLSPSTGRCPECGRAFDARSVAILSASRPEAHEDKSTSST